MIRGKLYIDGKCVEGKGEKIEVINPATGKVIGSFGAASIEQTEEALQGAKKAFKQWSFLSLTERTDWMNRLGQRIAERKEEILEILMLETGKNPAEAEADMAQSFNALHFFAEEAKRMYDTGVPDYTQSRKTQHIIIRRPLGVVVGHLAWNLPLTGAAQKIYPIMASGCTGIIKPSTSTPLATMKIGEICEEIGMPAGVINILTGPAGEIGSYLTKSTIPSLVTVVGSSAVGMQTIRDGATSVKHYSMELGGNAPAILFPDCDMEKAANWIAGRKVSHAGQGCANVNRIFVHRSLHDEFVKTLYEKVSAIPVGWGKNMPALALGPVIDIRTRDAKLKLVNDTIKAGAKLIYGGKIPEDLPEELKDGAFMLPTILDGVTDDMPIAKQEIFGPVYAIYTFDTVDEVIERSNNSELALNSYVFTYDARIMHRMIEELEFGEVYFNFTPAGASCPNVPHVGLKNSGVGCDRSKWAMNEYFNFRHIAIEAQ